MNVANEVERDCLEYLLPIILQIANCKVFLFYSEAQDRDGSVAVGNRLHRHELTGNKLINPKLLRFAIFTWSCSQWRGSYCRT